MFQASDEIIQSCHSVSRVDPASVDSGIGIDWLTREEAISPQNVLVSELDDIADLQGAMGRPQQLELVFDPFDLTDIEVRYAGRAVGRAVPTRIGRHAHPQARPEPDAAPTERTGIDYLRITQAAHDAATQRRIAYSGFAEATNPDQPAGQPQAPHTTEENRP